VPLRAAWAIEEKSMSVLASVIVPTFNAAQTLEDCLKALVTQPLPLEEYEIIVVDDGSTDVTPDIVLRYPSVRLIRIPHRGAATARNCGAREARADLLLFTDADCEPARDWIEKMLAPFAEAKVVGAKGVYRTRQRNLIARFVQLEYEEKYARMRRAPTIDFVDTYSAAYRREIFLAEGGFDESFPESSVEDQEFSFRLAEHGRRMMFVPDAVVYHQHASTLGAYLRRKFRIGYWKVRVHTRHVSKTWHDSHTPLLYKLQVGLFLGITAALMATPVNPIAWMIVTVLAVLFALSAIPLVRFIAQRDPVVAAVAPGMIPARAAAMGVGLVAGTAGEILRSQRLKRMMDIVGALAALVVFAPIMLAIAVAIKLDSPGPVLFVQMRAGKDGKPFRMYKFRSMVQGADALVDQAMHLSKLPPPIFRIPNDPRVTRVGRFIRRFTLDELPQLINVLKGEMSLVGPRPEELSVVAKYSDWHRRRLAMKPGMAGPMIIYGRGDLALDERARLEISYIESYSLWQDLRLLILAFPAVLRGRGAY
jgi:lipopolysaccharide/colanic/teichoic acid biosynthesis glycosyltransferase/GT2 family glycosyltransferase